MQARANELDYNKLIQNEYTKLVRDVDFGLDFL